MSCVIHPSNLLLYRSRLRNSRILIVPPWLAYVGFMIVALTHLGFWVTMVGSLVIYMGCVGLLRLALR